MGVVDHQTWIKIHWFWMIFVCYLRGLLFRVYRCFGCHVYTKHAVSDSLDTSQITYAMVWEDASTLREALAVTSGDRVICVASGGDNSLALLLDDPAFVIAVDFSSAQVALCQLKQTAIKHLTYAKFSCLLGLGDTLGERRVDIYVEEVRPNLTRPLRKYWDKRVDQIKNGLIYCGIYDKYFLDFARYIRPLVLSDDHVYDILSAKSLEEQNAMIDTYCVSLKWRVLCKLYFGDVLVGRCPPFYERCDVNVGEHFYNQMEHALREIPAKDNYFLEYVLIGKLTGNHGLPEYLLESNFSTLKSRIDRVRFVRSDIADFMRDAQISFNAIDLSNIFDFVPENEVQSHCDAAIEFASHGARICHWTFVPVKDCSVYEQPFSKNSKVNHKMSRYVNYKERAWFYQTFTLQTVDKLGENEDVGTHKMADNDRNGHQQINGLINGKNGTIY